MSSRASGVVLLDKPAGISSAKALAIAKRALGGIKSGHAGTLDPMATGLLVMLVGRATRCAAYAESGEKEYEAEVTLGVTTTTDDREGEVLTRSELAIDRSVVEAALLSFVGDLQQVPPQVSAIHVDGQRAYQRVRAGEVVEIAPRAVSLYQVGGVQWVSDAVLRFSIRCSKGFYVRSLARDLGAAVGCGGMLSGLRRVASHPFRVDTGEAIDPSLVTGGSILPVSRLFPRAQSVDLTDHEAARLKVGNTSTIFERLGDSAGVLLLCHPAAEDQLAAVIAGQRVVVNFL